jgi:hypothetical protein
MDIKVEVTGVTEFNKETVVKIINEALSKVLEKLSIEEEFEKPQHPEDVILVDYYLVNANVIGLITPDKATMLGVVHRDKDFRTHNKTWLIRLPRVKNHSDTIRRNTAMKLIAEKYGARVQNMEVVTLKLENYVPVEVPGSLFYNMTLE